MKLSTSEKKTPSEHIDSVPDPVFLELMAGAAALTRKDFQYGMRVSKQLVKGWFEGERHDPLRRARDMVALFRERKAVHLIPTILEYIAGSDFSGRILNDEEAAALMKLSKRAA